MDIHSGESLTVWLANGVSLANDGASWLSQRPARLTDSLGEPTPADIFIAIRHGRSRQQTSFAT